MNKSSFIEGSLSVRGIKTFVRALSALSLCLGSAAIAAPAAQATVPAVAPAVIGGSDVTISVSPWQAVFIIEGGTVCSGSLLSPTQIVTAAHCFAGIPASSVQAWAGITKLSDRGPRSALSISKITNHAGFNPRTYANDIALVTLAAPVPANLDPATIALPVNEDATSWPALGSEGVVSGWGETTSGSPIAANQLQAAVVKVLAGPSSPTCGQYGDSYLSTMQLCAGDMAGSIDACAGDSGGPLVFDGPAGPVLGGIVSTGQACAAPGFPGLYVRVVSYLPWLASQGVDVGKAGSYTFTSLPGSAADGKPSSFAVGRTYPAANFIRYAKLPTKASRIKVTGGAACRQRGQQVRFVDTGTCKINVINGKRKVPIIVTIY
jgi:secreted trypsin-like serine protease